MKPMRSLTAFIRSRGRELVVLGGVIILDRLGWLPKLHRSTNGTAAPGQAGGIQPGVVLLTLVTVAWACADWWLRSKSGAVPGAGTPAKPQVLREPGQPDSREP